MPADGGVGLVKDRPGVEAGLGGAEQSLDLQQVAIAQHGPQRRDLRVGPEYGDAVEAGFVGELAGIDLEGLAGVGAAQVAPIGRVADERLVALLQLGLEPGNDRLPVGLSFSASASLRLTM